MATESMVQQAAELLYKAIVGKQRASDNKHIRVLKDGSPEWMTDAIREAGHENGRFLPNDVIYSMVEEAAGSLVDDYEGDTLDGEDDYDAWYAEVPDAKGWVDEAVKEFGWPNEGGIDSAISLGYMAHLRHIFATLREWLGDHMDTIREGSPEMPIDCYNCGKEYPQDEMYEDNFVSMHDLYCRECVLDIASSDHESGDTESNFSAATIARAIRDADAHGKREEPSDALREWIAGQVPATK